MSGGNTAVRRIFAARPDHRGRGMRVSRAARRRCAGGDDRHAASCDTAVVTTAGATATRRRGGDAAAPVALDAELGAGQSCVVVNAGSGDIASHSPNLALAPASTEKLLTGLAVMSALGSDFRYETKVVVPTDPTNGTVDRVWLVGAGDPSLSTPDYPGMVESNPRRNTEEQATGPSKSTTSLAALGGCHRGGRGTQHPGRHPGRRLALRGGALPAVVAGHVPHRPRGRPDRRIDREPRHERDPTGAHGRGRSGGVRGDAARRPAARTRRVGRNARAVYGAAGCQAGRVRAVGARSAISWPRRSSPATTSRWRCSPGRLA